MATAGKHTGTGKLLCYEVSSNDVPLLYDPYTGRLIYDGDMYFNEDPPTDETVETENSITTYWGADRIWVESHDTTYTNGPGCGPNEEYAQAVKNWLQSMYGDGIPTASAGTTTSSYASASIGASMTEAHLRASSICLKPWLNYYHQGTVMYTSFTLHYWRFVVQQSGLYVPHAARFRIFAGDPGSGFYGGGSSIVVRKSSPTIRYSNIPDGRTYENPDQYGRLLYLNNAIDAYATADIRATGLPYKRNAGGSSMTLLTYTTTSFDPKKHTCVYGTLRWTTT